VNNTSVNSAIYICVNFGSPGFQMARIRQWQLKAKKNAMAMAAVEAVAAAEEEDKKTEENHGKRYAHANLVL
jgi:hypothetical protein